MTARTTATALAASCLLLSPLLGSCGGAADLTGSDGSGGGNQVATKIEIVLAGALDDPQQTALYGYSAAGQLVRRVSGALGAGYGTGYPVLSPDRTRVAFTADKAGADRYQVFVADLASDAEPLAVTELPIGPGPTYVGDVKWSPDGTRLLLAGDLELDGDWGLYVVPAAGGPVVPLSDDSKHLYYATWFWSPTGTHVAWMETDAINGPLRQMVVAATGGTPVNVSGPLVAGGQLRTRQGLTPWSPDGSRLAFMGDKTVDEREDLFTVKPDGTGLTPVAVGASPAQDVAQFEWSPGSSLLAFRHGSELKTVAAGGGPLVTISAADEWVDVFHWRPGVDALFWSGHDVTADVDVLRGRPAGAPVTITYFSSAGPTDRVDRDWRFSPDGARIAFRVGVIDILEDHLRARCLALATPGVSVDLLPTLAPTGNVSDFALEWTPDGQALLLQAFLTDTSPEQLFLARADGTLTVQVSAAGGPEPEISDAAVSTDGTTLAWIEGYSAPFETLWIAPMATLTPVPVVAAGPELESVVGR